MCVLGLYARPAHSYTGFGVGGKCVYLGCMQDQLTAIDTLTDSGEDSQFPGRRLSRAAELHCRSPTLWRSGCLDDDGKTHFSLAS